MEIGFFVFTFTGRVRRERKVTVRIWRNLQVLLGVKFLELSERSLLFKKNLLGVVTNKHIRFTVLIG